jgi:hypothetical protein
MPFIRGRYHINPIAGQALEAARDAEEALAALQQEQGNQDAEECDSTQNLNAGNDKKPIHRVEIEAAEVVPSHSGRAQRGFVARVHRATYGEAQNAASGVTSRLGSPSQTSVPVSQKPETHVFPNHGDLVDFLRNEFANDCGR